MRLLKPENEDDEALVVIQKMGFINDDEEQFVVNDELMETS